MAGYMNIGFSVSAPCDANFNSRTKGSLHICSSIRTLQIKELNSTEYCKPLDASDHHFGVSHLNAQVSMCVDSGQRWWEKTLKPNMVEINSAQLLVDALLNAGDRLAIIDFYSPGCGGCKTLHPKICQIAESNPNAVFLKVNCEELKTMCDVLHVPVLPFFKFYRGEKGEVCSFSCTNATIKKFKDAIAKYGNDDGVSLGPPKGLDGFELLALKPVWFTWKKVASH